MDNDTLDIKIDEFVAGSRKMNDQVIHEREQWNTSVTADAIRHYAYGISDDNPLWIDREYAGKSSFGQLVAVWSKNSSALRYQHLNICCPRHNAFVFCLK